MEYKFQDILKNIIPGFYITVGVLLLCLFSGILEINTFKVLESIPGEVTIFVVPLLFYVMGYLNDTLSSQYEYFLYSKILKRPSELLLKNTKSRYKINDLDNIKQKLEIKGDITRDKAYQAFQKANSQKNHARIDVLEFYVSYIFARNLMTANIIVTLCSLVFCIVSLDKSILWLIFVTYSLLSGIFIFRWRQKAFYYSKKVFNCISTLE